MWSTASVPSSYDKKNKLMHTVCALQTWNYNQKSLTDKRINQAECRINLWKFGGRGQVTYSSGVLPVAGTRMLYLDSTIHHPKKKNSWSLKMTGTKWYELIWVISGWCPKLYHAFYGHVMVSVQFATMTVALDGWQSLESCCLPWDGRLLPFLAAISITHHPSPLISPSAIYRNWTISGEKAATYC